jgi:ABC-type antimicrobial peptide transport system permease subunit
VALQFLTEAVLLSLFGGFVGVVVSVLGAQTLGYAVGWPLSISLDAGALAFLFSASVGVLFGWLPAQRAAQLDPIAALRDE